MKIERYGQNVIRGTFRQYAFHDISPQTYAVSSQTLADVHTDDRRLTGAHNLTILFVFRLVECE